MCRRTGRVVRAVYAADEREVTPAGGAYDLEVLERGSNAWKVLQAEFLQDPSVCNVHRRVLGGRMRGGNRNDKHGRGEEEKPPNLPSQT